MTTPRVIGYSASASIATANTWQAFASYAIPSGQVFKPKSARCSVTSGGSRSMIVAGRRLGTFDPNTNVFTDDGAVSAPDFYDRLFYRVVTTHSAVADTVTATYTNAAGTTSRATSGLSVPSAVLGGSFLEFALAATGEGVIDLTNVTDTAAPATVTDEVWGFRTLHEALGSAQLHESISYGDGLTIPDTETIFVMFNSTSTSAQQRFAHILGEITAA